MEIIKIPIHPSARRKKTRRRLGLILGFSLQLLALAGWIQFHAAGEGGKTPLIKAAIRAERKPLPTTTHISVTPDSLRKEAATLRDQAAFLAGMKPSAATDAVSFWQSKSWQSYAARLNQKWQTMHAARWLAVSRWAERELKFAAQAKTAVFYPFGGPDFLYASLLFPNASEYYLIGLEPIGDLPPIENFAGASLERYLSELESSLGDLMNFGFFKTNDMKQDFSGHRLKGVLPVLLALLTRTGHQVADLSLIQLDEQGKWRIHHDPHTPEVQRSVAAPSPQTIGVKIRFQKEAESAVQTLYYFNVNLENSKLDANREFTAFIESRPAVTTLIKSASYLMHAPAFSSIRELILNQSAFIVQDDSGIPLKYFDETQWRLHFYGVYDGPISLFNGKYQADLKRKYSQPEKSRELPFGIGYKWQPGTANLLLARKE